MVGVEEIRLPAGMTKRTKREGETGVFCLVTNPRMKGTRWVEV